MKRTANYALLSMLLIDLLILIFVSKVCNSLSYKQLFNALFMQFLVMFIFIDNKIRNIFLEKINASLNTLKVGGFFISLGSFYLMLLAKQGIYIVGGIKSCG